MSVLSPNMNLIVSTIGLDSGLQWEQNLNASLSVIDQHNHTVGNGSLIPPAGLNINTALTFNNQQATNLQATVFTTQSSLTTLLSLYVIGPDLFYNDGNGNSVQITFGGSVLATASGITGSGGASAAFTTGVLIVDSASNTPGNIKAGSILIGNNISASKFVTLSAPSSLASNYSLTLPLSPAAQSFLSIDTSGNIAAFAAVSAGITGSMIASQTIAASNIVNATITTSQIAALTILDGNIANGTITGSSISASVNLPGKRVSEAGLTVVVSNTNPASNSIAIVRGLVAAVGTISSGEGFTSSRSGTGVYSIGFTSSFLDFPAVTATLNSSLAGMISINSLTNSSFTVLTFDDTGAAANIAFSIVAIGQRT